MFKNLTNFSYKRNWKEAIGFYLAYLILTLILCALVGVLVGELSGATDIYQMAVKTGATVAVILSLIISFILLKEKKLFKNFGYIILAFFSGFAAVFGGALLGLLIPTFLTTKIPQD